MSYYIRVFSTSSKIIGITKLRDALSAKGLKAVLSLESGTESDWEQIEISHNNGPKIASVERSIVAKGSLGADEIYEFQDEVSDCQPTSAAQWLIEFFPRVKCIYAFQVLRGTDHENGWEIFDALKNRIWSSAPSIIQADMEGFSNEAGYHILWQFNETAKGTWWMGLLREGKWIHFQIDLGNNEHKSAFLRGEIPNGAIMA